MPTQIEYENVIQSWLDGSGGVNHAVANYAITKLRASYLRNYADTSITGLKFTALKTLQSVPNAMPAGVAFRAYLKESTVLGPATSATLRYAERLGLIRVSATNLRFQNGADAVHVTATGGSSLPTVNANCYLRVRHRANTVGLRTLTPQGALAATCGLQVQAQETTIVATRSNGSIARGNVEWEVAAGVDATVSRSSTTPFTLATSSTVSGLVQVDDYVQLLPRTLAPATVQPEVDGYYKVVTVFSNALRLDPTPYSRTAEGTYTAQPLPELPVDITDRFDWRVIRVRLDALYLRHTSPVFGTVLSNDYAKLLTAASESYVFKVTEVLTARLLLLNPLAHASTAGDAPPYTGTTPVTTLAATTCTFKVVRAPADTLALFTVTAPTAFSGVQVGDYARLQAAVGSSFDSVFADKYYRIEAVSGATLHLSNVKYDLNGQVLTSAGVVYSTFTDIAGCQVYRSTADYPYSQYVTPTGALPVIYKVRAQTPTGIQVERVRYYGYEAAAFELKNLTEVPSPGFSFTSLDDHFDVDVIQAGFSENLFLHGSGANLPPGFSPDSSTYAKVSVSTPIVHTAVYSVQRQPQPNILLLGSGRLEGRELEGAGSSFAPYRSASTAPALSTTGALTANFSVTQVDPDVYDRVVVHATSGTFGTEVQVSDYVHVVSYDSGTAFVSSHSALSAVKAAVIDRYFTVQAIASDRKTLTLALTPKRRKVAVQNESSVGVIDLDVAAALVADDLSSFAFVPDAEILRPAATTNFIRLEGIANNVSAAGHVKFSVAGTEYVFKIAGRDPAQAIITLSAFQISTVNNLYVESATLQYNFTPEHRSTAIATVVFQQQTNSLVDVTAQLAAFAAKLPAAERAAADQALSRLNSTTVPQKVVSDAALSALQQVADFVPEQSVTFRGDFASEAEASPAVTTTLQAYTQTTYAVSTGTANAVQQNWFQSALALLTVATYNKAFLNGTGQAPQQAEGKSVVKIKDLYVDASLQVLGYSAQLSNTTPALPANKKHVVSVNLFLAEKLKTSAQAALIALGQSAVASQADTTISALFNAMQATIPADFGANKRTYFVTGTGVNFDTALPLYPPSLLAGLRADDATERRRAIQRFVAIPPAPSVAVLRSSYARIRSRQRSRVITLADLQNHYAQTTDPNARRLLENAIAIVSANKAAEQAQQDALAAAVASRELSVSAVPAAPETDMQSQTLAAVDFPLAPPTLLAMNLPAAPAAGVKPPSTKNGGDAPASSNRNSSVPDTRASLPVTNLFGADKLDFRMLSAAVPLSALNAGNFNVGNYAYITFCNFDGTAEGNLPGASDTHHLEGLTGLPSSNLQYNQFKLTGLQESHAEKFQLVDTLSENFMAFAFGQRPEVWSMSGVLINDLMSNQLTKFRLFYEKFLRISALASARKKMVLCVPALQLKVYGYAVAFVPQHNPEVQTATPFTLQILVTNWAVLPTVSNAQTRAPVSALLSRLQQAAAPVKAPEPVKAAVPDTPKQVQAAVQGAVAAFAGMFTNPLG